MVLQLITYSFDVRAGTSPLAGCIIMNQTEASTVQETLRHMVPGRYSTSRVKEKEKKYIGVE